MRRDPHSSTVILLSWLVEIVEIAASLMIAVTLHIVVQEELEHKIGDLIYKHRGLDYCPARRPTSFVE